MLEKNVVYLHVVRFFVRKKCRILTLVFCRQKLNLSYRLNKESVSAGIGFFKLTFEEIAFIEKVADLCKFQKMKNVYITHFVIL